MASEQREEVIEYAKANPEEAGQAIAVRFKLNRRTVSRWLKAAGLARPPKRPPNGTGNGTPEAVDGTKAARPKRKARKAKGAAADSTGQVEAKVDADREPGQSAKGGKKGGARARPFRVRAMPAKDLPPDEVARLLRIIDQSRRIADRSLQAHLDRLDAWDERQPSYLEIEDPTKQAEAMKADPMPYMDSRQSQANLNHQRMTESMLAMHPGLMELANTDKGDAPEEQAARSDRVAAALGLPKP